MSIESFDNFAHLLKSSNLLSKYGLEKIGVFGSFARGEKANDIDIFIDNDEINIESLYSFKFDLEKISEKKIDLVLKKYANPIVLFRANKEMKYVNG